MPNIAVSQLSRVLSMASAVHDALGNGRQGKLFVFGELSSTRGDILDYDFIDCEKKPVRLIM